jgi:hypothetical protein
MPMSTVDFLRAASAGNLGTAFTAGRAVTIQPATSQQHASLQALLASNLFQARLAQYAQRDPTTPAVRLDPSIEAALASARRWKPTVPDTAGTASEGGAMPSSTPQPPIPPAAPAPISTEAAPTRQPPPAPSSPVASLRPTVFAHAATAEELMACFEKSRSTKPLDAGRIAVGAGAGAAAGLGFALVSQALRAVHPGAGATLDLGCMLLGAALGAGVGGGVFELSYSLETKAFAVKPAT